MRWEFETAFCRHAVVGSERSVVRWCCGEAHGLAEVVAAASTVIAGVAGNTGLESDTVSDGKALDIASGLYHDSCRLVAQCYGVFDNVSPYSAVLPVVDLCGEDFVSFHCMEQIELVKERGGTVKIVAISLTSEPQRPVAMTRTMISWSDWSVGLLRSSKANVPPGCSTKA